MEAEKILNEIIKMKINENRIFKIDWLRLEFIIATIKKI